MPTSSKPVRDYCRDLPMQAPEYLVAWAEKRKWKENALLFKQTWVKDPITRLSSKTAKCICTACREKTYEVWVGAGCHNGRCGIFIGQNAVGDYDKTICPTCGAKVTAIHISGNREYADEYAWPMTLHRIPEPGKRDRLALICWQVHKSFDQEGRRNITAKAYEAYIAEEKVMRRCARHSGIYYHTYFREWKQTASFCEGLQNVVETVCPEGIEKAVEGTTCENAKLELYMRNGHICFPAAWLRLWQMHPVAETLLTCGAGDIVGNLIGQEKQEGAGYRHSYNNRIPRLNSLNWKARRPWEILRMHGRDELREAIALQKEKNLGGQTWKLWMEGRAAGKPWTLEDAAAIEEFRVPERITSTRISPAKVQRYLTSQRRRWPKDGADEVLLADYWSMATEGFDLMRDPEMMWPDRLRREHDRLVGKRQAEENAAQDAKIEAWAQKLDRLSATFDGISIRPARSTAELEAEGKCLHHCVGSYAGRVARGETHIFFIRREEEPDVSWYTLNLDTNLRRVIQNLGNRNCDRTPDVQAFEITWLAWVQAGAKRDKNGNPLLPSKNKEEDAA